MSQRLKWIYLAVLAAILITLGFLYLSFARTLSGPVPAVSDRSLIPLSTTTLSIKNATITAEIATGNTELMRGLGGRMGLADGEGMWFEFGSKGHWGIWMKDMKFPIDIVWLDENLNIVDFAERVSPDTYPQVFYPAHDASFVLEIPSGAVEKYQWKVGDEAGMN